MVSRFTVLRFLWTAQQAGGLPDDEENAADKATRAKAHKALLEFVDRLAPESVTTPVQTMWEFKQAFILSCWERLRRLGGRYQTLKNLSRDDLNLLLGRTLWLSNSWHWAKVILSLVSGRQTEDLAWEPFIDGDQLLVSSLAGLPPEPHEAALSKDLVLEAIAYLRKVQPESMGPHWGIKPVAHANGRSPADILSLPDYQFPIANLWEEAERTAKVIETLESVRMRYPHLQGVNRTLVDCYLQLGDSETAAQRIQDEANRDEAFREDSIVRLFLRQCGKAQEAERHLKEELEKYESSPNSSGQRTAIRNVLLLTWKPFVRLSPDVQSRWIMPLHWCYGEYPAAAFSDTERAGRAIGDCIVAFETHLQETLFEPLRKAVTETEIDSLPDTPLKSFLVGRTSASLAMMLNEVVFAKATVSDVSKRLLDLLSKRCSNSDALRHEKFNAIPHLRNPNAHDCRPCVTGISIEQAQKCIELCQEFLTILETPPPSAPRPGQPLPGR